jgi:hypothetical protein
LVADSAGSPSERVEGLGSRFRLSKVLNSLWINEIFPLSVVISGGLRQPSTVPQGTAIVPAVSLSLQAVAGDFYKGLM